MSWAQSLWNQTQSLVWPVQCSGCKRWDTPLCTNCANLARGPVKTLILDDELGVPGWPLLTLGDYQGALRGVVLAAKHDRVRDLTGFLEAAGQTLGSALAKEPGIQGAGHLWVVPAPSSKARVKARAEIVPLIATSLARQVETESATKVRVVPAVQLAQSKPFRPQSRAGLSKQARGRSRAGSMKQVLSSASPVPMVIVDDVVASGATVLEMLRLLGPSVLAVASLAVSIR